MKSFFALSTLLAVVFAAPSGRPGYQSVDAWNSHNDIIARNAAQSVVTLRLLTTTPSKNDQQQQTTTAGDVLTVIVGQTLSRDTNPLHLQGIEILNVSDGVSLDGKPVDPKSVVCSVAKGFSSQSVDFGLGQGPVVIDGGEMAVVSRIECALRGR